MDRVLCEGYLIKAPPLDQPRSGWYKRYFALLSPEAVLRYYKDKGTFENGKKFKGELSLSFVRRINETSDHASSKKYEYGFELDTVERLWVFVADSEEEKAKWITGLTEAQESSRRLPFLGSDSDSPQQGRGRSKSIIKRMGVSISKIGRTNNRNNMETLNEASSSSSQIRHSDSSYFSTDDGKGDPEMSSHFQFEDDEDVDGNQTLTRAKSVSTDSAISSERSSRVRLVDGLQPSPLPISDEVAQREWMLRVNKRVEVTEVESDMPSALFKYRCDLPNTLVQSPTLGGRGEEVCLLEEFDQITCSELVGPGTEYDLEEVYDTPTLTRSQDQQEGIAAESIYDYPSGAPSNLPSLDLGEPPGGEEVVDGDPLYDIPAPTKQPRPVEVEEASPGGTEIESLYDFPSNVLPSRDKQPSSRDRQPSSRDRQTSSRERQPSSRDRKLSSPHDQVSPEGCTMRSSQPELDLSRSADLDMLYDTPKKSSDHAAGTGGSAGGSSSSLEATSTSRLPTVVSPDNYQYLEVLAPPGSTPPQAIRVATPGDKPVLPPRTSPAKTPRDRPPVPARETSTLPRSNSRKPASVSPEDSPAPARPPPSRPVPLPASTEPSHFDLRSETSLPATSPNTLTHAKRLEHAAQRHSSSPRHTMTLDRRVATGTNQYVPIPGPRPLAPRTSAAAAPPIPERKAEGAKVSRKSSADQGTIHHNPFLDGYVQPTGTPTPGARPAATVPIQQKTFNYGGKGAGTPPKLQMTLSKQAQELFDSIPDSPTSPLPGSTPRAMVGSPPRAAAAPGATTITPSPLNPKYPTIKSSQQGMVQVKQGYQNVTEVKGALSSSGSSVKGERHKKLGRRSAPVPPPPTADIGYTPMRTMEQRLRETTEPEPKIGYEPMKSHEDRLKQSVQPSPKQHRVSVPARMPPRPTPTSDLSSQPEFQRLEQLDQSLTGIFPSGQFIPFGQTTAQPQPSDGYLSMNPGDGYQGIPSDGYLSMNPGDGYQGIPSDGYLAMNPGDGYQGIPSDGYLAMNPGDGYQGIPSDGYLSMNPGDGYQDLTGVSPGQDPEFYMDMRAAADEVEYVAMDSG